MEKQCIIESSIAEAQGTPATQEAGLNTAIQSGFVLMNVWPDGSGRYRFLYAKPGPACYSPRPYSGLKLVEAAAAGLPAAIAAAAGTRKYVVHSTTWEPVGAKWLVVILFV